MAQLSSTGADASARAALRLAATRTVGSCHQLTERLIVLRPLRFRRRMDDPAIQAALEDVRALVGAAGEVSGPWSTDGVLSLVPLAQPLAQAED